MISFIHHTGANTMKHHRHPDAKLDAGQALVLIIVTGVGSWVAGVAFLCWAFYL